MKFSDYKDAQDFLQKSGFKLDLDSAITFLDAEIKKLGEENGDQTRNIEKI